MEVFPICQDGAAFKIRGDQRRSSYGNTTTPYAVRQASACVPSGIRDEFERFEVVNIHYSRLLATHPKLVQEP